MRTVLLALALTATVPSFARSDQIDATCQMPWWNMEWNAVLLGPIAQSFVATADRMDFVDLMMAEGPSNSTGVQLALNLRAGDLAGAVLATSDVVQLDDGANDIFRFQFDPFVALEVGSTYVFEIVRVSESGYAMVRGSSDDPCPDMHAWISGLVRDLADLWFQLGRAPQVGTSASDWGGLKWIYRESVSP